MSGLEAAICLKKDPGTRAIPIIMVTAFGDSVRERAPCQGYVDKPCDPRALVDELWSLLPASRAIREHGVLGSSRRRA